MSTIPEGFLSFYTARDDSVLDPEKKPMRPRFLVPLFFLGLAFAALQADDKVENPFKSAKVGDFLAYKTSLKGSKASTTMKQTVTAVTDKEVTIEIQMTIDGKDFPPTKTTIDLTKNVDAAAVLGKGKVEVKNLDSGKETLTINGKEYACTWIKTKSVTKLGDKEFTAEAKTWTCKDVPLGGVVKVESSSEIFNSTMELVEFGTKK